MASSIILHWRRRRQCKASCGLGWPTTLFFCGAFGASVMLHVAWDGQQHYFSAVPSAPVKSFMRLGLARAITFRRRLQHKYKASCKLAWPTTLFFCGAFGASVKLHVAWAGQQHHFSAAPSALVKSFMWPGVARTITFRRRLRRQYKASCGLGWPTA